MILDYAAVVARLQKGGMRSSDYGRRHDLPWVGEATTEGILMVARAICDELNAAIATALNSLDATALERLGMLIAEHALKREAGGVATKCSGRIRVISPISKFVFFSYCHSARPDI